ncbi:YdeI/OmpD-associated family protein [Qipengyuania gaetbuli]|uniref:YdeI/OmpD-associated family protein n=1 Tax=Qipengyuania gaetbuli TaxID=266952 RepID=UPI001CFD6242|nr:YdeI/OmpD-associated family protein [Qipengyuania gaetbuli]
MAKAADPDFRHPIPPEIQAMLDGDATLSGKWQALTSLARNEWVCWTISAKQEVTRQKRRARLREEVLDGKKRPCCWPGCPHRRESARKWVDA